MKIFTQAMNRLKFCSFFAIFSAILILTGCNKASNYRSFSGSVWHTSFNITYRAPVNLDDSIAAAMRRVERSLSPFDSTSIVSAVNRGENPQVDELVIRVFEGARQVWEASSGAFDPTVAPLVNLWGFGWEKGDASKAPSAEALDSMMEFVGFDGCAVVDRHVIKKHPAMQFDFSAITKGLGCDEVGAMLRRNGATDYLVEIGGEIALSGLNPYHEPWHVMIDAPVESDSVVTHQRLTIIQLSEGGVATSGNYRNYRDTDRGRVGHTINPRTGMPQQSATLSATVVAPSCMLADACATACMVLQPDSALAMAEALPGVEVLLVVAGDTDSTFTTLHTEGFPLTK